MGIAKLAPDGYPLIGGDVVMMRSGEPIGISSHRPEAISN
jgi:hypothetical protein